MNKYPKLFAEVKVGQSFTVPWAETDRMGLGRPEMGATVGFGGKVFKLDKTETGIKVTRLE